MNTTGIFSTHVFDIPFTKYDEPIYLIPFGDVHRSSPMCDEARWLETLEWGKKKPRCYWLGMGDYDDLGSSSERLLLTNKALHDSTVLTLEDLYLKHTKRFAKEIEFMRGKLVGVMEGNHYGEFQNATTTTQKLAELMGCKYLGVSSFIRLRFLNPKHNSHSTIDLWTHHGRGAARLVGGSLNSVENMMQGAEADVYLMGHDHRKTIGMKSRLRLSTTPTGIKLSHRKVILGRTGSFLKAYEEGRPSYVVDAAMHPTELGVIKLEMTPRRDRSNGGDNVHIDLHGSI
jgi:hypothetical protein